MVHTARMPGQAEYDEGLPFPVVRDPAPMLLPTMASGLKTLPQARPHSPPGAANA